MQIIWVAGILISKEPSRKKGSNEKEGREQEEADEDNQKYQSPVKEKTPAVTGKGGCQQDSSEEY